MCTWSEKLWGFQATCNPHDNYVHVMGYPVLHGVFLHFLWGKHLQCNYTSWPQCGNLSPKFVFYISMFNVVLSFWFDDWIISIISGSNKYRISSYKARGNYFFNCLLFKGQVNKFAGIIIQGRTLNEEKRYMKIFHPVQGQPLGIVIK